MVEALHHIKSIEASNTVAIATAKTMPVLDFASLSFLLLSKLLGLFLFLKSKEEKHTQNYTDKVMNMLILGLISKTKLLNCSIRFKS